MVNSQHWFCSPTDKNVFFQAQNGTKTKHFQDSKHFLKSFAVVNREEIPLKSISSSATTFKSSCGNSIVRWNPTTKMEMVDFVLLTNKSQQIMKMKPTHEKTEDIIRCLRRVSIQDKVKNVNLSTPQLTGKCLPQADQSALGKI